MVRPTAAPVDNPPLLVLFGNKLEFCESGGCVGVNVTVRTCPVTVSSDTTGVGNQVLVDRLVVVCEVDLTSVVED